MVGESLAAGCGVAVPKLSAPGVDLSDGSGLSIAELDHANVRKLELAGVDDLDYKRFVTTTDRFKRVIPVRIEKVRDHNGKTPTPRRAAETPQGVSEAGRRARSRRCVRGEPLEKRQQIAPPVRARNSVSPIHRPSGTGPVAGALVACRCGDDGEDEIDSARSRAEVDGGEVDHDRGLQFSVSDRVSHVGRHPSRDVPVHAADVVAGLMLLASPGSAPRPLTRPR